MRTSTRNGVLVVLLVALAAMVFGLNGAGSGHSSSTRSSATDSTVSDVEVAGDVAVVTATSGRRWSSGSADGRRSAADLVALVAAVVLVGGSRPTRRLTRDANVASRDLAARATWPSRAPPLLTSTH